MSKVIGGYCNSIKCRRPFEQLHDGRCPHDHCKTEQYESKENCPHCCWPLPLDSSKECFRCKKLRTVPPDKVPCVFCTEWLKNGTVNCSKCSAPQDYNALKKLSFAVCKPTKFKQSCGKIQIATSKKCWNCGSNQEQNRALLPSNNIRWGNPYWLLHLKEISQPKSSSQHSNPSETTNGTELDNPVLPSGVSNHQQHLPHFSSQTNTKRISQAGLGDSNTGKSLNVGIKTCCNPECRKSLQQKTHTCPHCSKTQYDSSEDCPHCYWPLPSGKEEEKCMNCYQLKATHPITHVPCVLCGQWLDIGTENLNCLNCSAPQNYDTLLTSTFKNCNNYPHACSQQALMIDSKKCFSCGKGDQWRKEGSFSFDKVSSWSNPYLLKHLREKHQPQSSSHDKPQENDINKPSSSKPNNSTLDLPINVCDDNDGDMNRNGSNSSIADTQWPPQTLGIQLHGYSRINHDQKKPCVRNWRCGKIISQNAAICPHCNTEQYKSKESCTYCYWPLPLDEAENEPCLNCGQLRPLPHQPVEYVPCVLCSDWVKKNEEKCSNCSAPQNYGVFRSLTFKRCKNNESCNRILILDSKTCYSCRQHQFPVGQKNKYGDVTPLGNNEKFYPFENIFWDNPYLLKHLEKMSESTNSSQSSHTNGQSQYVVPVKIYTPQTQNSRPHGFCDPNSEDQLCIVFRALVYKEAWGWNDDSQIYMRFGEQHYGDFKYDFGPGEITRNGEEFLSCEFQCHFKRSLIQRRVHSYNSKSDYFLQYKYTVFTGKATKEEDVYEFLNGVQIDSSVVDRALVIPFLQPAKERIYQYDTLVCPQLKRYDSWSIASWLPSWLHSAQDFADEDKLCRISLKSYLGPFKQRIFNAEMSTSTSSFVDISEISDQVVRLFHCLSVRHTYKKWDRRVYQTEIKSIKKITLSWIEEVIREFEETETLKRHHQIYGIAAVLLISKKLDDMTTALEKAESFLFRIFGSFPSSEPLNDMVNHIKNDKSMKSLIVNALENEVNRMIAAAALKNSQYNISYESVLIVLVGIHVLKGDSTSKPVKFRKELLKKKILSLRTLLSRPINIGFVSIVEKLKPFFDIDPLLPTNLLYICPLNDFPSLCDNMELNLVLGVMHYNVVAETLKQLKENEVSKYITGPLKIVQKRLLQLTLIEEHRINLEESFENLAKVYLQRLSSSDNYKRSAFLIFCVTYTTFCSLIKDEGICIKRRDSVQEWFSKWITSDSIVNSSKFGTKEGYGRDNSDKELQVWEFIFNEKNIKDMLKLTPKLKHDWHDLIIKHVVESRINRLSDDKAIVDKFISIETKLASEEFLVEIFLAQASVALNRMFDEKQSSVERYFTGSKSDSFAKLLGKLLLKQYKENEKISLASVLEWDLWPSFFKLYGSAKTSKADGISDWESRCMSALLKFQILCEDIKNRQMSFQQVKELEGKIDRVLALCLPSVSSVLPDPSTMKTRIAERRREYESFITLEEKLFHFIKHLKNVPVKGLDTVVKIQDSDETYLSKLCSVVGKDGRVQITCYEPAKPLLPHIEVFCQLAHEHSSKLFHHFWKLEVEKIAEADGITFDEVVTLLWSPTLKQITDFIPQLKSKEIKLTVLDETLKELYDDSLKECSCDIQRLCQILAPSIAKDVCDTTWISEFCEDVTEYQILCGCKESAKLFASLYKDLKLTGDFTVVERIAKGVQNEKCLKSIDKTLIDAGKFLVSYTNDPGLQECLQEFVQCSAIVKWIRTLANKDVEKSTQEKDVEATVNDLQNFVNIALATAAGGEGDMATDRLVALRTVGSGFGQLIYQLPQTSGFSTLRDVCISLQKADQTKTELLSSLKLCEDQIEWYKSIRETQGSVEKTSFGQMRNINSLGVYEIGSMDPVQLMSRTEAICVRLVKSEGQKESLPKYKYTFDELRDLESKLVLIAGQQSPERKEVDQFLDIFHSVCRIADVLIELQHHGNSDYIQWCLQFSCNMHMTAEGEEIYHLLKYQAKKMEGHLKMWLDKVKEERSKFNELNYFTTPQLLILRKELGKFEASSQHSPSIKAGVVNLLYGITDNRDVKFIKERLNEVNSKPTELDAEEPSNNEDVSANPDVNQEPASEDKTVELVPEAKSKIKRLKSGKKKDEASSHWPKPSLKREDLNEDQEGHLIELEEDAGYHELLILLALEMCSKDAQLEDIMKWCQEHEGNFTYPSTDSELSDEGSDSESSSDEDINIDEEVSETHGLAKKDEATNTEEENPPSIVPSVLSKITKATQEESPADIYKEMETTNDEMLDEHFENMIEIKERVPLDENHDDVQILTDAGFDLDEAIEALTIFPDEVDRAVVYLNDMALGKETSKFTTGPLTRQQSANQSTEQDSKVKELKKMRLERLDKTKKNYMPLPKLGRLLQNISRKSNAIIGQPRCLPNPDIIKSGEFNLVVVSPELVLKTTLSLYMEDQPDGSKPPLPTYEEVLICTEQTTAEEVTLLWKRAFNDPDNKRIFCLVHAELLSYQVCDVSLQELQEQSRGKQGYKIVIVCSNVEEEKSIIIPKLQLYRKSYVGIKSDKAFLEFLTHHFKIDRNNPTAITKGAVVDEDNYRVRILSSTRTGMGKSLYVQHLVDRLREVIKDECYYVIPIHGPKVDADSLIQALNTHIDSYHPCIFHIDISQTVLRQMGMLLFNLLVLQAVCDSTGQIWRVNPNHLYVIEITVPPCEDEQAEKICRNTVEFLNILPTTTCNSPNEVLKFFSGDEQIKCSTTLLEIYKKQFESPSFQRTFQYSQKMLKDHDIDAFHYDDEEEVVVDHRECLQLLLKKSELKDPSWLELRNFICFFNEQLERTEKSWFCDETLVKDTLSGFKTFIVKFMTIMSKDFCTSSLKKEVAVESGQDVKQLSTVEKNEISDDKKWHSNYHPYLFFNNDAGSMSSLTFVGFYVNDKGDVINPSINKNESIEGKEKNPAEEIIVKGAIHKELVDTLKENGVNLKENYHKWEKETEIDKIVEVKEMQKDKKVKIKDMQIDKIAKVMGIAGKPMDPDTSYVLTYDNVIKILAIQMKFRCNIPVVIMGETGCGKTRLIRYMCDLAAQGGNQQNAQGSSTTLNKKDNMLIMKVHGGTTSDAISKKVEEAETLAMGNKLNYGIDTVLFFDEANTTDAIGLIKEVMCDRRLNGKNISSDLKFIAACNPYRKHHKDMIAKLESAGLGFCVKATEAQEKLGEIPLRELVYRVFDLPPSMRPLVYDFGKLDDETEDKYTKQMVMDRCRVVKELEGRTEIIQAVSKVLTWSQSFMKEQTDECSFVSLRDIDRALIVFEYFYGKREKFIKLIQVKAGENSKLVGHETWALIMSLSVCYHARLQERDKYETEVVEQFISPLDVMEDKTNQQLTKAQFKNEIIWCQDVLLDHMTLGPNIARNAALKENVFMMAICVQLKIPLFLVGKPGSSKSLAKSIIADSLNQQANEFLKDFNEVHMFSYQCSQLSTPESVIEIFTTAKKFQEDQKNAKFTSVVVLDEVGLAEDSPNLPLKALHPLLEDGTEKNDQVAIAREKRVAFIGISNWALDPAKMNRGVMVTRADPNCDELILSAEQICTSDDKKKSRSPDVKPENITIDEDVATTNKNDSKVEVDMKSVEPTSIEPAVDLKQTPEKNQPLEQKNVMDDERKTDGQDGGVDEKSVPKNSGNQQEKSDKEPVKEKGIVVKDLLKPYFRNLAEAYLEICKKQDEFKRSFFGLRDFYSLIKMLYAMCKASKREPTDRQLEHAIKRNFGGYNKFETYEVFQTHLKIKTSSTRSMVKSGEDDLLNPDCSPLGLIVKSLQTKSDGLSHMGESRYLLFLTENNAALQVLQHKLHEAVGLKQQKLPISHTDEQEETRKKEPFVLFGSSFPKDREYTQVCRNINQIKICMETGRTVILLNLENLYESLYDLLNQYHIVLGDSRYVDLGLQTHRVKCRVDSDFKLILIAERETVYETFPIPLINRLEKHFVLTETILLDWQSKVLKKLRDWVEKFTNTRRSSYTFSKEDAIVGYQPDTPASVIFQVTKMKKEEHKVFSDEELASVADEVYELSMKLLLQMASPDALIRLQCTALKDEQKQLCQVYFVDQKHDSLTDFVSHQIKEKGTTGLSAQITTHSHLLSSLELKAASKMLGFSTEATSHFLLQEFDAELDFTKALDPIFTATEPKERLLIIQCDTGHLYGDLIASARYRIDDQREKVYQLKKEKSIDCGLTHVIMIVNLPRYVKTHSKRNFMFVGFQGGSWVSAHIDDVHVTESTGITLNDAMSASISELFYSMPFTEPKEIDPVYAVEAFRRLQPESIIVSEEIPAGQIDQEKGDDSTNEPVNDGIHVDDETTDDSSSKETTKEPLAANQDLKKEEIEHTTKTDKQLSLDSSLTSSVTSSLLIKQKFFDLKKHVANGKGYTQCIRLHFCIQSAVSMIAERDEMKKTWAAKRVKLLLKLIPKVIEFPLGIETFYGALVWRILDLLKDREKFQHTDWVLNEALNVTSLQSGGTFQNVLAKKIDQVLTPLFANILSFVDCYHNMDLLMINIKDKMTLEQKLWFRLFNHPAICDFSQFYTPSEKYRSSELQESLKQDFKCRFPFFWVVKEKIDSQIQDYTVGVNDMKQAHSDIYRIMSPTPLAEALCIIPAEEEELEKYCEMYLADFLRSVHNMTHSDTKVNSMEMEILHDAIYAVTKGPNFTEHHCLLSRIIAVHVTFELHQKEIMWLGQLASLKPGLLSKLKPKTRDCYEPKYIDIHLHAVQLALDDLEIPLESSTKHNFPERHCHLQTCQNIISSILEGASDQLPNLTKQVEQLRFFWNYLRIIKLFVEHIALDYKDFVKYAKRIQIASFSGSKAKPPIVCKCDCSTLTTFLSIESPFKSLVQDLTNEYKKNLKKGKYYNTSQLIDVKRRKKACLSEIISTIFFGEAYNSPERELIAELIDTVFTEQKEEEVDAGLEMDSGATDKRISDSPSFLLQLLLEYNLELVMEELKTHFNLKKNEVAEQSRYLLCIQCFEDARGKAVLKEIIESQDDKTKKLEICKVLLKEGAEVLRRSGTGNEVTITVEYLKAVANIRYVCSSMAEILYERKDSLTESEKLLLAELKAVCEDKTINDGVSGPGIFLMKQIAREHGVSFLVSMLSSKSTETQWIIPEHLRSTDPGKSLYEDRFLSVYKEEYKYCYDVLVDARLKLSFKDTENTYKTLTTTGSISMLLAMYQIVTMSYGYTEESSKIPESVKESLLMSFDRTDHYSQPLKDVVKILVNCTHWKKLPILKPTIAESEMLDRLQAEVLVHAVIVFLQKKETDIFKPFINFLTSPESMKYAYLPTCPGSLLDESIKFAMGGAFSWCPKGDPYFITECNVLKSEHKCPKCGTLVPPLSEEEISKANKMDTKGTSKQQSDKQQSDEQQPASSVDVAQQSSRESTPTKTKSTEEQKEVVIERKESMGYTLGSPSDQYSDTHPNERNLSESTCGILRVLMNACLTWTACTNEGAAQGLTDLFKSKDDCPSDLPSFFWDHFKSNIKMLSKVLSRSEDDVCLLLHLVLKKISTRFYPNGPDTKAMSALKEEEDRAKWENSFSRIYIAPVIDGADDIAVARVEEKKKNQSLCVKKELNLSNVFDLLRNKSARWDDIGQELGVELNDRESLSTDRSYRDRGRLEEVLNLWLESTAPTWDQFIVAMKKLEYNDIVDSLTKKPCEPAATPSPADKEKVTSPKTPPSVDHNSSRGQPPDKNPLHYTIYERVDLPHPWQQLWPYRSKVTLETFFQKLTLQWDNDNSSPKYPVLYYLCKHELMLNATQYLPDLIRLQESLFKVYNRRIDEVEAHKITIREFIKKLPKLSAEATEKQFSAVKLAWNSVKNNLHKYGRINVPDEYKIKSWDINTLPIEYIIPNLKGPGVCTVALLEALVQAHNGFIDNCRLEWRRKRSKENIWAQRQVLVKHVQHCHLVEYQHQLLPMVLSHCHYSLDQNKKHVVYEFDALEKRFTDKFVHGRPTIKLEILEVKYREFSYSIANVKRVVDPKELDTREKIEIMNELKSTPDLRSTLDIIEIIMGFMSIGQYRANMKLSEFVTKYLKMADQFPSKKGLDHCNLEHVLCLWRILSVELSLRFLRSEQAPFSGLGEAYLQPLKKDDREALRKFLKIVDSIEKLLHSLFEFIETFVKHSQDYVKNSWSLIDAMVNHADGSLEKYEDTFPEGLTVGQVVAVWKEIAVTSQKTKVIDS